MAFSWKEVRDALDLPFATAWDSITGGFISRNKITWGPEGQAFDVNENQPLPVAEVGQDLVWTEVPSTLTTGGAAQTILAADAKTRFVLLQNKSGFDLVVRRLNFGPASLVNGITIAAGRTIEFSGESAPKTGLSLFGGTTGQNFYLLIGKVP